MLPSPHPLRPSTRRTSTAWRAWRFRVTLSAPTFICLLTTLAIASAAHASSQVTLSDLTSSAKFDPDNGLVEWKINGKNYLKQQWFWYRIGASGPEYSLDSLPDKQPVKSADNNFNTGIDTVSLRNADLAQGLQVDVVYVLSGVESGTQSDITEAITIKNKRTGPMSLHFFQYADLDLGESDKITFPDGHSVRQEASTGVVACETVITPPPRYREVHEVSTTLYKLNADGVPTTLDNTLTASGDVSWAFQWDVTIPAGGSFQISKDKQITPEPGALTFLVLGGLLTAMRRKSSVRSV